MAIDGDACSNICMSSKSSSCIGILYVAAHNVKYLAITLS